MNPPENTHFRTPLYGLLSLFLCEELTIEVCPSIVGTPYIN
jgi:hypothetical protein